MDNPYRVIKAPLVSEKSSSSQAEGKYTFWVDRASNKIEIKKAVKEIYGVDAIKVHVLNAKGKKRRLRYHEGKRPDRKKAIVTLKEGQTIEVA